MHSYKAFAISTGSGATAFWRLVGDGKSMMAVMRVSFSYAVIFLGKLWPCVRLVGLMLCNSPRSLVMTAMMAKAEDVQYELHLARDFHSVVTFALSRTTHAH